MTVPTSTATKRARVLIIGGGFTGLTAANELRAKGIDFLLLEGSSDHLGGRAYSYRIRPSANPRELFYDHGAEYLGDLQTEIMALVERLAPGALVNGAAMRHPYPEEIIILAGKRYTHPVGDSLFGITGVPPTISIWDVLGLLGLMMEIVGAEQRIDVVEPWSSPDDLLDLDRITLEDWFSRDWISPTAKDLVRISIEALLSVEAKEVSPFYLFWYTACNNGFLYEINDNQGGAQQYWLSTGMSELAERYAAPVRDRIERGVLVRSIDASGSGPVKVSTTDGRRYDADRVIVAMAPHTAGRITFTPELPANRKALQSAPMGRTLKCQVYYRSAWWRNSHGVQYGGWAGGAAFPIVWVMDNSPLEPSGANVLMTFTVGAQADQLGPHPTKEKVTQVITESLAYLFNDLRALSSSPEFIELVMFDWNEGSFIGGGPNTIMTPGMLTGPDCAARALDEPWLDKVFFASAETARKLDPTSKLPTYDPSAPEKLPKYDDDGTRSKDSLPPFQSRYSDMRQSLGYMDGGIVAGRYVADRVEKSLLATPGPAPTASPATPPAKSASAPVAAADPSSLDPSKNLPPLGPAETLAILTDICAGVQTGSAVDVPAWIAADWTTNAEALQGWVTQVVVAALVAHGQIADPTDPMQVLLGIENCTRFGLAYSTTPPDSAPPADRPTIVAIANLTRVASALMQAKSAEPFPAPAAAGASSAAAASSAVASLRGGAGRLGALLRSLVGGRR